MSFAPDLTERIARARADLRMGVPVVLEDGLVFLAVETLSQARFDKLRKDADPMVLSITGWRAQTLKARAYDNDIARVEVPSAASARA